MNGTESGGFCSRAQRSPALCRRTQRIKIFEQHATHIKLMRRTLEIISRSIKSDVTEDLLLHACARFPDCRRARTHTHTLECGVWAERGGGHVVGARAATWTATVTN